MSKIRFVPVEFDLRDVLGVSTSEYILLWIIYYRQNAPGGTGWCDETKQELGDYLGMTKRNVHILIDSLIKMQLIESHKDSKHLRITKKWYDRVILNREDEAATYEGKNFPQVENEREEISPTEGRNFPHQREKISLPLYKENINKKTKKEQLVIEIDLPFKSDEFRQAWLDFAEHRKEIKKPMTARAAELKIKTIEKNKWTEQQTIEYIYLAIEKGWHDIYQPNFKTNTSNGTVTGETIKQNMANRSTVYGEMFADKKPG
jgi:hypothetical protein